MLSDDQNPRRHFEAAIAGIASMYGVDPLDVRDAVKQELILSRRIQLSTTELPAEELKGIANKLTAYTCREEELPPEWKHDTKFFYENLHEILTLRP